MVRAWVLLFVLLFFLSELVYAFSVSNLPSAVGINQHFTISWTRDDDDPKHWSFVKKGPISALPISVPNPDEPSGQVDGLFFAPGVFTINAISSDSLFKPFFTSDPIEVKFHPQNTAGQDESSDAGADQAGNANSGGDNGPTNNNAGSGGAGNNTPESASLSSLSTSSERLSSSVSLTSTSTRLEATSTSGTGQSTNGNSSNPSSTAKAATSNNTGVASISNDTSSSGSTSATDLSSGPIPDATASPSTSTISASTTQPTTNQQDDGQAPSKRPAIIAASIIGAIIFISLLVFFYLLYNRRRKRLLAQRERMMESFSFERDMEELRESAFRGIDRSGNDGGLGAGGAFMVPGISILGSSNAMNAQEGRGGLNGRWKSLKSSISRTFTLTTISSGPVTGSMFYGSRRESPGSEPDESWRRTSYFPST